MKKLRLLAFYALATPVITLGAGSVLAEQYSNQAIDRQEQSTQRHQDATQSTPLAKQIDKSTQPAMHPAVGYRNTSDQDATQGDQSKRRVGQSNSQTAAEHRNMGDQSHMHNRGYMGSAPANGIRASNLIGAGIKTSGDEDVGPVSDLIIDENGQVVAIVVGVGGFLGMGERDVAIGWDDVTRSGTTDDLELRIDETRESLHSAPEFESQD